MYRNSLRNHGYTGNPSGIMMIQDFLKENLAKSISWLSRYFWAGEPTIRLFSLLNLCDTSSTYLVLRFLLFHRFYLMVAEYSTESPQTLVVFKNGFPLYYHLGDNIESCVSIGFTTFFDDFIYIIT